MTKNDTKTTQYIRSNLCPDAGLCALEKYAAENSVPVVLPESAAFLRQLIMLKQPQKVLEIGLGIGYSGHIILQSSNAHLFTTELEQRRIDVAKEFFTHSGLINRVTFYAGDEAVIIPEISGQFDFIFLDGAKNKYIKHLPYLKKLLIKGGVLLADNVLFGGMVAGETEVVKAKSTIVQGLRAFVDAICKDKNFYTSIIPVGDGMSVSIKLGTND